MAELNERIGFFHTDLDGAGCTVMFTLANMFSDAKTRVIHCSNSNIDQKVQDAWDKGLLHDKVMICFGDICPGKEMLEKLLKYFPLNLFIYDHHKSNMYIRDIFPYAVIISERENGHMESGTSLMYQHYNDAANKFSNDSYNIFNSNYPKSKLLFEFVDTVRSYDTWEWKKTNNTQAKQLQTLYHLLGMERFVSKYVNRISNADDTSSLIDSVDLQFVTSKMTQEQRAIDNVKIENVFVTTIKDRKVAIRFSNGGINVSEMSSQFLAKYPEVEVFITINLGVCDIQYRTNRDDIDVSTLFAIPMGGGGHQKSSGSPISQEIKENIISTFVNELMK
jgi:oligoribonuclease NrnB/cAMP/cGMP phosphodiesterase (DHH superfamily)